MATSHTISFSEICKISWDTIDAEAQKLGMDRSGFVQMLAERYFDKKKFYNIRITEIVMLIMLALILLFLVILW